MKITSGVVLSALLVALIGCGDDSKTPQEKLVGGTWVFSNSSGSAGLDLIFNADASYSVQLLELTSTTTANDQVETGVYSASDSKITFTPQKYTCPGPDPIYRVAYTFNGESLALLFADGVIAFERYTGPAATNFTLTFGCFQDDGSFVPSPLAPVSN